MGEGLHRDKKSESGGGRDREKETNNVTAYARALFFYMPEVERCEEVSEQKNVPQMLIKSNLSDIQGSREFDGKTKLNIFTTKRK